MKTILIDIDGVLAETHRLWLEKINQRNNTNYDISVCNEWSFHTALGLGEHIYSYWDDPGHFEEADVVEGAQEALELLWKHHKCYIVGAAPFDTDAVMQKWRWLRKHFPFILRERIVFARDKSIVHGDILIDDHPLNVTDFVLRIDVPSREAILFNRPWNLSMLPLDKVTRMANWNEILNKII